MRRAGVLPFPRTCGGDPTLGTLERNVLDFSPHLRG